MSIRGVLSGAIFLIPMFLTVSEAPSYGQIIELAHNEPFSGEKSFCVEVTGTLNKAQPTFLLTYILQLEDKGIPITYKLNGKLKKDVTVDNNFQGQETVQHTGKYVFTFCDQHQDHH